MKRTFIILLLLSGLAFSQTSPLDAYYNKTHRQLAGSPTASTKLDTLIFTGYVVLDSVISAINKLGVDNFAIISTNYSNIGNALDTARTTKYVVIVPVGETGSSNPASEDSSITVWDFRNGKWKVYGTRQWGFGSVVEADSLNRFQKIVDSTTAAGTINLGDGTWSFSSFTLPASKPLRIVGTAVARPASSSLSWTPVTSGTVLKSTSGTSTTHLLNIGYPTDVYDLTLLGNNRTNGIGFYGYRGDGVATTQGDYSFNNSLSLFHGGDGVRFVSPDGNLIKDVDAFNNNGYGIVLTSTYGNYLDGYQSIPSTNGNVGGFTRIFGGRTRFNQDGGFKSFQQSQDVIIGLECISDSTVLFTSEGLGTTSGSPELGRGSNRDILIGNDFEFVLPPATYTGGTSRVSNVKLKNHRSGTFLNNVWGSIHTQGTYTADGGTSTTLIVDTQIIQMPRDYYTGWMIDNVTRSASDIEVDSSYNSGTSTILRLATSVAGQTTGDSYRLQKNPDRGLYADSLWSGLFINNSMASEADSAFVFKNFGYPMFIGSNPNFSGKTDLYRLGSAEVKWFSLALDKLTTGGDVQMWSNAQITIEGNTTLGQGDSVVVRALSTSHGVNIEALNVVDLQREPSSDTGQRGDVLFHRLVSNNVRPETRWYFDADTSGSTRRAYFALQGASGQSNRLTFTGSTDSTTFGMASAMELTGNDQVARYMDVLASNNRPETNTLLNNRVRLYAFQDRLWGYDDNGDTLNVMPYSGSTTWNPGNLATGATDSTSVTVTNAAVGDIVTVGHSGITTPTANIQLFGNVVSAGTVRVFARNNSAGTYDIPSGTVKVRVFK